MKSHNKIFFAYLPILVLFLIVISCERPVRNGLSDCSPDYIKAGHINYTSREFALFTDIEIGISTSAFEKRIMKFTINDENQVNLFGYLFSYNALIQKDKLQKLSLTNYYTLRNPSEPKRVQRDYIFMALLDSMELVLGKADEYITYLFSITMNKEMCSIANWYLKDKTISIEHDVSDLSWSERDSFFTPAKSYILIKPANIESPRVREYIQDDIHLLKSFSPLHKDMIIPLAHQKGKCIKGSGNMICFYPICKTAERNSIR